MSKHHNSSRSALRKMRLLMGALALSLSSLSVNGQAQVMDAPTMQAQAIEAGPLYGEVAAAEPILYNTDPDFCINTLAGFQTENPEARYQFYALTQEIARDAAPDFRMALTQYGEGEIEADSNILDIIEDATNPVIRQAAPEITISNLAFVIDFAAQCSSVLDGQINSLKAYDPALSNTEFNAMISEDALFLRQILSDSLYRLGADKDPRFGYSVNAYADSLVRTRDAVEFSSFVSEVDEIEKLFMTDLDGRLKRSNDMINEEMDREVMGDAIGLSNSMNEAARRRAKEERILSLIRIMGGRL